MTDDKIFLERKRDTYFISRGESPEKAKRVLVFYLSRCVGYDKQRGRFQDGYAGMAAGLHSDVGEPLEISPRFARAEESKRILGYAARRTAGLLAAHLDLFFEDLSDERDFIDSINGDLEEIIRRCSEEMRKERMAGAVPAPSNSEGSFEVNEDIPF